MSVLATRLPNVGEVMTSHVVTVAPDTPLKQVVITMLDREISATPVVRGDGALAGIVTEADLVAKEAFATAPATPARLLAAYFRGIDPQWMRKAGGLTAGDVMTGTVVTARPGESVTIAARRMLSAAVKRLVVIDDNNVVVGIVSRRDLLRFFAPSDAEVELAVAASMANPLLVPEGVELQAAVDDGRVVLSGSVLHPSDVHVVEAAMRRIPGVVDVDVDGVAVREPEPSAR